MAIQKLKKTKANGDILYAEDWNLIQTVHNANVDAIKALQDTIPNQYAKKSDFTNLENSVNSVNTAVYNLKTKVSTLESTKADVTRLNGYATNVRVDALTARVDAMQVSNDLPNKNARLIKLLLNGYKIPITANPNANGKVGCYVDSSLVKVVSPGDSDKSFEVAYDSSVELRAIPDSTYVFNRWDTGLLNSTLSFKITEDVILEGPYAYTAYFIPSSMILGHLTRVSMRNGSYSVEYSVGGGDEYSNLNMYVDVIIEFDRGTETKFEMPVTVLHREESVFDDIVFDWNLPFNRYTLDGIEVSKVYEKDDEKVKIVVYQTKKEYDSGENILHIRVVPSESEDTSLRVDLTEIKSVEIKGDTVANFTYEQPWYNFAAASVNILPVGNCLTLQSDRLRERTRFYYNNAEFKEIRGVDEYYVDINNFSLDKYKPIGYPADELWREFSESNMYSPGSIEALEIIPVYGDGDCKRDIRRCINEWANDGFGGEPVDVENTIKEIYNTYAVNIDYPHVIPTIKVVDDNSGLEVIEEIDLFKLLKKSKENDGVIVDVPDLIDSDPQAIWVSPVGYDIEGGYIDRYDFTNIVFFINRKVFEEKWGSASLLFTITYGTDGTEVPEEGRILNEYKVRIDI
jgi:hypothetical protein